MTVYNLHGQEVYAVEAGSPNRQTAILIHGWSSSWYALSPLLQLLSLRFHCLAVDLPGYGQSPPLPGRTTLPAYADVLTELIARVSNGPVVLVGHSVGGMAGITLALRQPALVERLVLIALTITGGLSTYPNLVVTPVMLLERYGQDPTQETREARLVATLQPGQITGELAVLDQGLRSADLIAGPEGARLLALDREHLLALCEDDSVLGTRLLLNIPRPCPSVSASSCGNFSVRCNGPRPGR